MQDTDCSFMGVAWSWILLLMHATIGRMAFGRPSLVSGDW